MKILLLYDSNEISSKFIIISIVEITGVLRELRASLVAQLVKNLPAMWGTWLRSLDWEDPQETHSSTLAWRIPWTV